MSITDELRSWAEGNALRAGMSLRTARDQAIAIADRIDAEYERAVISAMNDALYHTLYHANDESMAELGLMRLPEDADGEYIHVGDAMEWARIEDDGLTIVREVSAVGNDVFFAWSDEQHRYAQYESHAYRHHHAPTVEDVLREFARKVAGEECMTMRTGVVEEYAAKLREALDE